MPEVTSSDGVRIVYDDLGAREGMPVVLCHGLAAAGEQMAADARYFADAGYRVLVPDLRGHGRSGKPEPMAVDAFSIAQMAADLRAMLHHAGVGPVHWVGNSLGGILALKLLEQSEPAFRTLATYGTAYRLSLPRWFASVFPLSYRLAGPAFNAWVTARATTRDRDARRLIERLMRDFDPAVGGHITAHLVRYDLIEAAKAARLPMLLIHCGRDRAVNAALGPTLAAMAGRPNFSRVDIAHGGHCANLDATAELRQALAAFWAAN